MTNLSVSWVRPDQLGDYKAHRLGGGGQGTVYGVPAPPGKFAGEYLAYKEYGPGIGYDADVLHDMVCFRLQLPKAERDFLDQRLAWPRAMVYTGSPPALLPPSRNADTAVRGFLMQRVTRAYELHSPMLPGPKQQALEFLLNDDGYGARIGLFVNDAQRLQLLLDLARTLQRLHGNSLVVGDLSPKNVLFTLIGQPRCLFIDCDSMRYRDKDVLPQVDTPDWEVPEPQKGTIASDSWKFGLIATRVFNRDQSSTELGPLRAVSTELVGLAQRARRPDPPRRPAMSEWVTALELAHHRLTRAHVTANPAQNTATATPGTTPGRAPAQTATRPRTNPTPQPVRTPPPPPSSGRGSWVAWTLLALLLLVGGGWAANKYGPDAVDALNPPSDSSSSSTLTDSDDRVATSPGTGGTEETPASVAAAPGASVDYSQVADDPEAEAVAGMFARFFGAVNNQDYDTALSQYDPTTEAVDLDSDESRAEWKKVMSTTQDRDLVLSDLRYDGGYTLATMNFRSRQDPGYGPATDRNETCTDWTVTYQLTGTDDYRIYKAPKEGVSHSPC
ncbi:hypothetical protein [Streptomyces triticisoli]|jgi:hypothetical protein|uniref:hypothetical protein n=1 Tax=Streptomyces triticisoli TaxID=2182797 RepID=UPI000DDB1720|nr:hypothetical protein [Streptomyces triticisoli]